MSASYGDDTEPAVPSALPKAASRDRFQDVRTPVEDLNDLIRRAWTDVMKAREHGDGLREQRAERRMNALLGRLSAHLQSTRAEAHTHSGGDCP